MQEMLKEYAKKIVEHRVKNDKVKFNKENIEELQKTLNAEKEQLDKLKDKQYKLQNDFCDTVWNFSKKHDFGNFFVNYPRQKVPSPCNCEFFNETAEKVEKEILKNEEIQKLTYEITSLKLELENLVSKNKISDEEKEEEIENISDSLHFPSEEDIVIQRLTNVLEKSQQKLKFLEMAIKNYQQSDNIPTKIEEINSLLKTETKITKRSYEKPSKKLKLSKEFLNKNQIPLLNCPNTIDNYLIVKRKFSPSSEERNHQIENEGVVENFQLFNNVNEKSVILSSWTRNSNDSFINAENSIPNEFFFQKAENSTSNETISKNVQIKSLVSEEKLRGFTPKKQSTIAEKFSKKLNDKLNKTVL